MTLNYNQVLQDFIPSSEGDFLRLYKLKNGSFAIYKTTNSIECLELTEFKDISPIDLAVALNINLNKVVAVDEFSFSESSTKEEVIKYLFDIEIIDEKTGKIEHSVQPFTGFLLIEQNKVVRNVLQSNNSLLLDNRFTYQDNNHNSNNVFITFDVNQYERLISEETINNEYRVYLFASASSILFNMVYSEDKAYYVKIGKEDPVNVLLFYSFIMNKINPNSIYVDIDSFQISIGFNKEKVNMEDVLNLAAEVQKTLREEFEDLKTIYRLKQDEQYCYVIFRNVAKFIYLFNHHINSSFELNLAVYN